MILLQAVNFTLNSSSSTARVDKPQVLLINVQCEKVVLRYKITDEFKTSMLHHIIIFFLR